MLSSSPLPSSHLHHPNELCDNSSDPVEDGSVDNPTEVVLEFEKLEKLENPVKSVTKLEYECSILRRLQTQENAGGIPDFKSFQTRDGNVCLRMGHIGCDLQRLIKIHPGGFSLETVLFLADQLITIFKYVHGKGFIHRNVCPEHLVMGTDCKNPQVYLVSWGLAMCYIPKVKGENEHIKCLPGMDLNGTATFASRNKHKRIRQSRRDDMESLGYVLLYLFAGSLPWAGVAQVSLPDEWDLVKVEKEATSIKDLCLEVPEEFVAYFEHVRGLEFSQEPDYEYLRQGFLYCAEREKLKPVTNSMFYKDQTPIGGCCLLSLQKDQVVCSTHTPHTPRNIL